jgi:hypothetical protein
VADKESAFANKFSRFFGSTFFGRSKKCRNDKMSTHIDFVKYAWPHPDSLHHELGYSQVALS